ncbi:MAG: NAD(P)-dependent oxidoreductase [Christensenellales bacterium]|jgi:3-hydroxyisobutyrate dehydrogenase-like beta-hydroxyacid dehydrogenase
MGKNAANDIKTVGFIGLGRMGSPMAMNLIKGGYSLLVYDLIPQAMAPLAEAGAKAASSIAELTQNSDAIITILPADREILDVYAGPGGIIESAAGPKLCIEMTSAMGSTLKHVAQLAQEKGALLSFVDAPVSGGVDGAVAGTLTIMSAGEEDDVRRARPLLEAMGKNIFFAGKLGDGKTVKMINQLLNAVNTAVAAEAMYLAKRLNVDIGLMLEIVGKSSGNSWVMQGNVPKFMLPKKYDAGFKLGLMTKDLALSLDESIKQGIDLPIAGQALREYRQTIEKLGGEVNYNAVGEWIEDHNCGE